MKLTIDEIKSKVVPMLRASAKDADDLKTKLMAYIDGAEIIDADGNAVEIERVDLTTMASGEAAMDDEDEDAKAADEDDDDKAEDDDDDEKSADNLRRKIRIVLHDETKSKRGAMKQPQKPDRDRGGNKNILPPNVKRFGTLQNFREKRNDMDADVRAYRFGQWCLAAMGNEGAKRFCRENGIGLRHEKTHVTNVNSQGGFLVPEEFGTDLIDLREQYGVFRANAMVRPMSSDTRTDPRRKGGLDAVFVGENKTTDESTKEWDQVRLTAKKLMVLTRYTNEINEDAVISIGDDLAGEISYAFALKEDQCGFNGDGTSTFGGITGVRSALRGLSGTIANIAGLVVASGTGYGTNWDSITLADFNKVVGTLPEYAEVGGNVKWFVSKPFYGAVMERLMTAAGGNTVNNIAEGGRRQFLNYQVEIAQVMPRFSETSQVACLFGNLRLAASFGDRRQDSILFSEHETTAFQNDAIAIRGTERFDINVHDVGNASGTASEREAGPMVGLITASS